MNPSWHESYEANWATIPKPGVWEAEIEARVPGLKPGDMLAAIRALADHWPTGPKSYSPRCNDIVAELRKRVRVREGSPNDRMVATVESARELDSLKAQNAPSEDFQRLYAKWRQTWGADFVEEVKGMTRDAMAEYLKTKGMVKQ